MKHYSLRVAGNRKLNSEYCPLPLEVIPNNMGINLCSVHHVSWVKQESGELISLHIKFIPSAQNADTDGVADEHM